MLTLLAVAATVAMAGCGGKSTSTPHTTGSGKQPSHAPAY
jgi:hypothetical protein